MIGRRSFLAGCVGAVLAPFAGKRKEPVIRGGSFAGKSLQPKVWNDEEIDPDFDASLRQFLHEDCMAARVLEVIWDDRWKLLQEIRAERRRERWAGGRLLYANILPDFRCAASPNARIVLYYGRSGSSSQ